MALDAGLELLIAVVRKPNRLAGKRHGGERDVEHEGRVIPPAEPTTDIGELSIDARGLELSLRLAEQIRDRLGGLIGGLHTEHELERADRVVVPGEPAFRLEKHRIDGLSFERAIQDQQ